MESNDPKPLNLGAFMSQDLFTLYITKEELVELYDSLIEYYSYLLSLEEFELLEIILSIKIPHYIAHLDKEMAKKYIIEAQGGVLIKKFKIRIDDLWMISEMLVIHNNLSSNLSAIFCRCLSILQQYPNLLTPLIRFYKAQEQRPKGAIRQPELIRTIASSLVY